MKFNELNDLIPYAKGGKEKILRFSPYPNITLAMPGRHAADTVPVGGDFVVMVTDPVFTRSDHQFTHTDIFKDVEMLYTVADNNPRKMDARAFMGLYLDTVRGAAPTRGLAHPDWMRNCINPNTFLTAVQCLAVAEHRRYAKYESQFGGRYLPFRFAAGIAQGLWTAADAANLQRRGRPGVEMLEKQYGVPDLTKELMK